MKSNHIPLRHFEKLSPETDMYPILHSHCCARLQIELVTQSRSSIHLFVNSSEVGDAATLNILLLKYFERHKKLIHNFWKKIFLFELE